MKVQARRRKPMARWFVDRLHERGIPSVSLRRLLPGAHFVGGMDWEVSGCCDDHRRLDPGQLFVAVPEARPGYDGHRYIREALDHGAAGVVVERLCPEAGRLQVVVADARAAHARICQALSGDPSEHLTTLGITGSQGKTITAVMIRSILDAAGERFGLIGPSEFSDGTTSRALGTGFDFPRSRVDGAQAPASGALARRAHPADGGALGAARLAGLLAEMVDRGCKGAIVEISGDALENRGFEGITFDAAVVTNIAGTSASSPEALNLLRRTNAKLFRQLVSGGLAVVNADDRNAEMLGGVNLEARRIAFALEPVASSSAMVDISARLESLDGSGTRMLLHGFDREIGLHLPLVGMRAATCALAAATLAWGLGIDRSAVVAGLESLPPIAGYLEAVFEGQNFEVRIDGARTPAALGEALAALRSISSGRIHCVISSDGCVDRAMRRELAATAETSADRVVLTLGDPRTEDPGQILNDLLAGFQKPGRVLAVADRRTAIEAALEEARCGDAVLVAGKGRNAYQIFADRVIPFDDNAVTAQLLRRRRLTALNRSA
jgi:UDP-N-acetylmuramoyl-L-alanyl-D-glutamate--2,6-diaminopimelate ligase